MPQPYLLPPEHRAIPLASLRRHDHNAAPALKANDPAVTVMVDFRRDPVLTVTEDMDVESALDGMFRLGVRVFLVVREGAVVGVLSIHDARRVPAQRPAVASGGERAMRAAACDTVYVADVMVPCTQAPAIDWLTLQQCRIRDLGEIFDGYGADYLLVLEDDTNVRSRVRGLMTRDRVERQLSPGRAE
jgi:CBS domain-containing protein